MKHAKKLIAIAISLAMIFAMGVAAFGAEHTVSTSSTTHTYQIYQIFTGEYDSESEQLQNLKYGANAKTGTTGSSVTADDMAALATIEAKTYNNDQEKITDLLAFVDLTTTPVAEIGKGKEASATLAEGYYIIKDTDGSLEDPETYTLYLFKVLNDDLTITPKDGTTTADKTVTGINDVTGEVTTGKKGEDFDEGDSIPYSINITFAGNVTSYKTYTVTLTDTLSEGLTPPALEDIAVTFKDSNGNVITGFGTPTVSVNGQVITVTYTIKGSDEDENAAVGSLEGSDVLNNAVINVSYSAVLNDKAKTGVEGNPNTYTITYSNNPNGNDTGTTPDKDVIVYTYELEIEKIDGNETPLAGAGFTLYKEVTSDYTGAMTGAAIKANLDEGVDSSKLVDGKYYVPVSMGETINKEEGSDTVTSVTHRTETKIDAGNYVLIETTVPPGYNAYEGMEITITSVIDEEGNLVGLTATPETLQVSTNMALVSGRISNQSGSVLPTTGGIGTTVFYIVGGVIVLGAVILLVARRRMKSSGK